MTEPSALYSEGLHVFYNPYSDSSARVLLALAEKGERAELHAVDLLKSAQLTERFREITPRCEVPAIVHNGKPMHESADILLYLEEVFPSPRLVPSQAAQRKEVEQWLHEASRFHDTGLVEFIYATGIGRRPRPQDLEFYRKHVPHRHEFHLARLRGERAGNRKVAEHGIREDYARLEKALSEHPWLAGDDYSLADLAWFPSVFFLNVWGFAPSGFPRIVEWVNAIKARPAFHEGIGRHLASVPDIVVRNLARLNNRSGKRR